MKKIVLSVVLMLSFLCVNAQRRTLMNDHEEFLRKTVNPPKNSNFTNYTTKGSVSMETGKFGIKVPFYSYHINGVDLSLGLGYSTSGVKNSESLSNIGQDWVMYGLGKVTRIQKGAPDDIYIVGNPGSNDGDLGNYGRNTFTGKKVNSKYVLKKHWNKAVASGSIKGSATTPRSQAFMTQFPNVRYYDGHGLNPAKNEIESLLANYSIGSGVDTQRDIFSVNVGDLSFHFLLRLKDKNDWSKSIPSKDISYYVEAVPIDKSGVKIEFKVENIPYWNEWVKTNDSSNEDLAYTKRERLLKQYAITGFTITDNNGVKYVFDSYVFSESEFVKTFFYGGNVGRDGERWGQVSLEDVVINEWLITKVVFPNKEEINYKYEEDYVSHPFVVPRKHDGEYKGKSYNNIPIMFNNSINLLNKRYYRKNIKSINFNNYAFVNFTYVSDTRDELPSGLNSVVLKDFNGNEVKRFTLEREKVEYYDQLFNYTQVRYFLNKITDSEKKDSYQFSYNNKEELGNSCNLYEQDIYGYYLGNKENKLLPAYPQFYILPDNYNGNKVLYDNPKDFENDDRYYTFKGVNKFVNSSTMANGTMREIRFPTGGILKINYEPNTYYNKYSNNKKALGPGVRTSSLQFFENISETIPVINKTYSYDNFEDTSKSSGIRLYKPSFAFVKGIVFDNEKDFSESETNFRSTGISCNACILSDIVKYEFSVSKQDLLQKGLSKEEIYKKMINVSTHALGNTSDIFGREILYTNVSEKIENNSLIKGQYNSGVTKKTFFYDDNRLMVNIASGPTDDYVDLDKGGSEFMIVQGEDEVIFPWDLCGDLCNKYIKVDYSNVEKKGKEIYPFPDREYFNDKIGLLNGKLKKLELINSEGKSVLSEDYEYIKEVNTMENSGNINKITNLNTSYLPTNLYDFNDRKRKKLSYNNIKLYLIYKYSGLHYFSKNDILLNSPIRLQKKVTKNSYNDNVINLEEEYDYSSKGDVIGVWNNSSTGKKQRIIYSYPYTDYHDNPIINETLKKRNIVSLVKSIHKYEEGQKLSSEKKVFKEFSNSIILPEKAQTSKGNNGLEDRVVYHSYDDKGNPTEVSKKDGTRIVFIWGYQKTKPIAKIENTTLSHIPLEIITNLQNLSNLDSDDCLDSESCKEKNLRIILNNLRSLPSLSKSQVTTYTYNPLIGITSITDPRGETVYYKYDVFNRLKFVKDVEGNLLKEYKYKYKN